MDTKKRHSLLTEWANNCSEACLRGHLGPKVRLSRIEMISGPRTAALDLFAGFDTAALLKALNKAEAGNARQLVPWSFEGRFTAYMNGKAIRIEVPWNEELMLKNFRLDTKYVSRIPHSTGRWVAGINLMGGMVTLGFTSFTPHYLVAGTTGSGKSVAICSMAYQLSAHNVNKIVLIDGKMGEGLSLCAGLPNQLGPMVTNADLPECFEVLSYLVSLMNKRYQQIIHLRERQMSDDDILAEIGRVIIFIDEVQELIKGIDQFTELLRKLSTQSRAAFMHLVLSTQHPTSDVFEDPSIKATLLGRVTLKVSHAEASRSALGAPWPRADFLLGQGDAYCKTASSTTQRVQLGYIDRGLFEKSKLTLNEHPPVFSEWPQSEMFAEELLTSGSRFDPVVMATGMISRSLKEGRVRLNRRLAEAGISEMGKTKTRSLLTEADLLLAALSDQGYCLLPEKSFSDTVK